jgi:hypothetical protein
LFNLLAELDEVSFRSVVHQAREELERLPASDEAIWRLVNTVSRKSPLILSYYPENDFN